MDERLAEGAEGVAEMEDDEDYGQAEEEPDDDPEWSDRQWLNRLAARKGLRVLASVETLVRAGVNPATLLSDLRDLAATRRSAYRTSGRKFTALVATLTRANRMVLNFLLSDGVMCVPQDARADIFPVWRASSRLTNALKREQPKFPARLKRDRKRAADLQKRITRYVERQSLKSGGVKRRRDEALNFLFAAVTEKKRSIHAQRVAAARLRATLPEFAALRQEERAPKARARKGQGRKSLPLEAADRMVPRGVGAYSF